MGPNVQVHVTDLSLPFQSNTATQQNQDDIELARLEKRPVLKRNFGLISMLGFSCTLMVTWEATTLMLSSSFHNGGYAGSIWSQLLAWVGTLCAFITMGEIASMAPTAGGQYHWVAMLAPKSSYKFLSYLTGWATVIAWQATVASGGYICASLIQSLCAMNSPSYQPQVWQIPLIFWAVVGFTILVNISGSKLLSKVEAVILFVHIFGFFAILIPLVYWAPHTDAKTVFTRFHNGGAWSSDAVLFLIGMIPSAYCFLGADGTIHMSEEIKNAQRTVPLALIASVVLNGILGMGMNVAMLVCMPNPDTVMDDPSGNAFIGIFEQAVGANAGSLTMASLITVMNICALLSFVASASRVVVKRRTLPLASIWLTMVISFLLSLIIFGSPVAFDVVISLIVCCMYGSYLIGNSLLLYRRLRGHVQAYDKMNNGLVNTPGTSRLSWGPWRIAEPLGSVINILGSIYLGIGTIFAFFPLDKDPTPRSMNYASLMVGICFIFAVLCYVFSLRKIYTGPRIEVDTLSKTWSSII